MLLVECGAQTAQSVAYPGLRGPERDVEQPRDLTVGVPVKVGEFDRLALPSGEVLEGGSDVIGVDRAVDLPEDIDCSLGVVLDVAGVASVAAFLMADAVDRTAAGDRQDPRHHRPQPAVVSVGVPPDLDEDVLSHFAGERVVLHNTLHRSVDAATGGAIEVVERWFGPDGGTPEQFGQRIIEHWLVTRAHRWRRENCGHS